MMQQSNYQFVSRLLIWCALEIVLASLNLDNLADYSEFLDGHVRQMSYAHISELNDLPPRNKLP